MKIGVTGGIGSGKSLVVNTLASLGAKVYLADNRAKELVYLPHIRMSIIQAFGEKAFENDQYNTKYISGIVFNDDKKLAELNSIIHPAVFEDLELFYAKYPNDTIVYESALMIETGHTHLFDKVLLVTAPLEIKIKRVMERDNIDRMAVLQRMNKQWTDEQKIPFADIIIENIDKEKTMSKVKNLWINNFQ